MYIFSKATTYPYLTRLRLPSWTGERNKNVNAATETGSV